MEIRHYPTRTGHGPFQRWLDWLASDNLGDCRFCGEGVWELRVDVGPGYRVYSAQAGRALVLLLCGGDKRTQPADIATAIAYWQDYLRRAE